MSLLNANQINDMAGRMTSSQADSFNAKQSGTYLQVFIDGSGSNVDVDLLDASVNDTSNIDSSDWANTIEGDHMDGGNLKFVWSATRNKRPC